MNRLEPIARVSLNGHIGKLYAERHNGYWRMRARWDNGETTRGANRYRALSGLVDMVASVFDGEQFTLTWLRAAI